MAVELVGKKLGMTRLFEDTGVSVPVSVISVSPNRVTQIKTEETDGYEAVQVVAGAAKPSKLNMSQRGLFAKAKVEAGDIIREFSGLNCDYKIGDVIDLSVLDNVKKVDVRGLSKGKGFAGGVKRWNFRMQDANPSAQF